MFRSLRFRMAASHAGVLAVILLVLGGIGQALLARSLDNSVTSSLRNAAVQEADRFREARSPQPPPDSDVPSRSAVRIGVFLPGGKSFSDEDRLPAWIRPGSSEVVNREVQGEPVRLVTVQVRAGGRLLGTVVAGRSLVPETSLIHRVRLLLVFGGLASAAASLLAGWWLAGRAVRPVRQAYEAQASFAADASHELRTPLTYVRQAVELMAGRDPEPELGREVLSELDYLASLTSRLLLLARADRGVLELERRPLDLAEVCRSAARRALEVHGLRVELPLGDGPLPAVADRVAAEAALDAVLENVALHGGGSARLGWSEDGASVVISVVDQGPGLTPEQAASAFERFFRADPSRSRESGGAGLGLPLARSLVLSQSGSMWLEPTKGGGLTVKMSFPSTSRVP